MNDNFSSNSRQRQPLRGMRSSHAPLCFASATSPGVTRRHHPTAGVAAARAEVDDPVGARDDVHVVLDDDDGVARVDEAVQLAQQQFDVGRVQARRRLVEEVERVAAAGPLQFGGELDPLRLAAGELGRGLSRAAGSRARRPAASSRLREAAGTSARNSGASSTVIAEHVGDRSGRDSAPRVSRRCSGRRGTSGRARRCPAGTAVRPRRTPRPGRSRSGPRPR